LSFIYINTPLPPFSGKLKLY